MQGHAVGSASNLCVLGAETRQPTCFVALALDLSYGRDSSSRVAFRRRVVARAASSKLAVAQADLDVGSLTSCHFAIVVWLCSAQPILLAAVCSLLCVRT